MDSNVRRARIVRRYHSALPDCESSGQSSTPETVADQARATPKPDRLTRRDVSGERSLRSRDRAANAFRPHEEAAAPRLRLLLRRELVHNPAPRASLTLGEKPVSKTGFSPRVRLVSGLSRTHSLCTRKAAAAATESRVTQRLITRRLGRPSDLSSGPWRVTLAVICRSRSWWRYRS